MQRFTLIVLICLLLGIFFAPRTISSACGHTQNAEIFLNKLKLGAVEAGVLSGQDMWSIPARHFGMPSSKDIHSEKQVNSGDLAEIEDSEGYSRLVIGLNSMSSENYFELLDLISSVGGKKESSVFLNDKVLAVLANIPSRTIIDFQFEAKMRGLAKYVNPEVRFEVDLVPNDVDWTKQWALRKIEADWAWNTTLGDPSIMVAVIDTGIDYSHTDLRDNYIPLGYDFVNNDTDPMDDNGHGTHCAGILGAVINNSIGIAGVADVQIIAEKALNERGVGYEDWLANAIIHAVNQGADIITMSWGSNFHSNLIHEALIYAYNSGVVLVAAAGNQGWGLEHYPAAYDEVIAVSATNQLDEPAWFTNFADWVEVAAPGESIYSTFLGNGYAYRSGTSMACPHVAGSVALILGRSPNLTQSQIRHQLRLTADDLGSSGFDEFFGYGRVNARSGVEQAIPNDDLLISRYASSRYAKPEELMNANITILNFGRNDQNNVTVEFKVDSQIADSTSIKLLRSGESATISFDWDVTHEGIHNVSFCVIPVIGEANFENNARSITILVRTEENIYVPGDFRTIKEAVEIANPGFKIKVASGLYKEHIIIHKSLELVGEKFETTIIDGDGVGTVLIVFETSHINMSGFTVQNSLKTWGFYSFGIYLCYANNNTLRNVTVANNNIGLYADHSNYNDISSNLIQDNHGAGLVLSSSDSNNVINNTIQNNEAVGISIEYSANNNLRSSNLEDNWVNFGVKGEQLSDFIHNVDTTNMVNGKPIYYWVNKSDLSIPIEAGYVAIVNSTRIRIENLASTNNSEGLLFAYATKCIVKNISISGNLYGIRMTQAHSNFIEHNTAKNNWVAMHAFNSTSNQFANNFIDSLGLLEYPGFVVAAGISIDASSNTTILQNSIYNHNFGSIHISRSHSNLVKENSILNDRFFAIGIYGNSSSNSLTRNRIENNSVGIWIRTNTDSNGTIYHNNFISNSIQSDLMNSTHYLWDNGLEGNFWSDYENRYPNAQEVDDLGIWNLPYEIDENNRDNYPLMTPFWSPYDINHDETIGIDDVVKVAEAFGAYMGHSRWIPIFDVNNDRHVNIIDIIIIASHFGDSAH